MLKLLPFLVMTMADFCRRVVGQRQKSTALNASISAGENDASFFVTDPDIPAVITMRVCRRREGVRWRVVVQRPGGRWPVVSLRAPEK